MLLLLESQMPGQIREYLLIAYYRLRGCATLPLFDTVVKLCSACSLHNASPSPSPSSTMSAVSGELFTRLPIESRVIGLLISRFRQDDIYGQLDTFTDPEHRFAALSTQAAMMFVILFFASDIL